MSDSAFRRLFLDTVATVIVQPPSETSLIELLRLATPTLLASTDEQKQQSALIVRDASKRDKLFRTLQLRIHPDEHVSDARVTKLFQDVTLFYDMCVAEMENEDSRLHHNTITNGESVGEQLVSSDEMAAAAQYVSKTDIIATSQHVRQDLSNHDILTSSVNDASKLRHNTCNRNSRTGESLGELVGSDEEKGNLLLGVALGSEKEILGGAEGGALVINNDEPNKTEQHDKYSTVIGIKNSPHRPQHPTRIKNNPHQSNVVVDAWENPQLSTTHIRNRRRIHQLSRKKLVSRQKVMSWLRVASIFLVQFYIYNILRINSALRRDDDVQSSYISLNNDGAPSTNLNETEQIPALDLPSTTTTAMSYVTPPGCLFTIFYSYTSASLLWHVLIFATRKNRKKYLLISICLLAIINLKFNKGKCNESSALIIGGMNDKSNVDNQHINARRSDAMPYTRISFSLHDTKDDIVQPDMFSKVNYRCADRPNLPPALAKRTVLNFTTSVYTDLNGTLFSMGIFIVQQSYVCTFLILLLMHTQTHAQS